MLIGLSKRINILEKDNQPYTSGNDNNNDIKYVNLFKGDLINLKYIIYFKYKFFYFFF